MNAKRLLWCVILLAGCVFVNGTDLRAADAQRPLILFSFGDKFDIKSVEKTDCSVSVGAEGGLAIETGHAKPWPGITLKAPAGKWDLSKYEYITVDVKNHGGDSVAVNCRVDNPGADGTNNCITGSVQVQPKKSATLRIRMFPSRWRLSEHLELVGMRGYPSYSAKVDTANITQLLIFVNRPDKDHAFEIGEIRAGGEIEAVDAKNFIPFIDEFGQYIHRDWPGKTHSEPELVASEKSERRDIASHPGPTHRNKYGGWRIGPQRRATGSFRVEKYLGKWWFVDPDGCLFWSHGIDCVHSSTSTPITDREHYFSDLPESNTKFARFYGTGSWAPHGYYKDHSPYKTYDYGKANLLRKYGNDWQDAFAKITHERIKSWGLNTIGNWSDRDIYLMQQTPYVCTINSNSRKLEGSEGYWGKFFDVFDPGFGQALRTAFENELERTASDPWCIGYFVHNEISWGDEVSLAVAALMSPSDQPAKQAFVKDLKDKYSDIGKLNNIWGLTYTSWDDVLQSRKAPDRKKAWDDLSAFYTRTAETYFRTIRAEMTKVAPLKLYLGCRFAWANDNAVHAAGKYCDVVSFNKYNYSVEDLQLPAGIDRPVIIGEFHFGALDRGMFHTGLKETADQNDRAEKYKQYVRGALRNSCIIGTHWFQYKDQATTGRGDGENYQIGFVDICNRPYPEIVEACREVGKNLYEFRLKDE